MVTANELTGRKEAYHGREESPATSDRRESHCRKREKLSMERV